MLKDKKTLIVVALGLILPVMAGAEPLNLSKGTIQFGGHVTFETDMAIPEEGDSTTGFIFSFSPIGGYFLMDKLELVGIMSVGAAFGDLYDQSSTLVDFGIGAQYYIDVSPFCLHLGALLGMSFILPDGGDTAKFLRFMLPVGMLFPFNAHVALDVGLQFIYTMGLDNQGSSLEIPIGYLGVQSFFL